MALLSRRQKVRVVELLLCGVLIGVVLALLFGLWEWMFCGFGVLVFCFVAYTGFSFRFSVTHTTSNRSKQRKMCPLPCSHVLWYYWLVLAGTAVYL
jgi:divalent metal cation (Fe/Co/Zn/Cd) transporter